MESMLTVTNLEKQFAGHDGQLVKAVDGVSFSVEKGNLFTLLGPSGCGKTTTLRCVAGLEKGTNGRIVVGQTTVYAHDERINVPAHARRIGMVFQSYAIWPHMTVFENTAFPLQVRRPKPSAAEIKQRVMASLALVQLDHLAEREATKLSGGQQQRLALARALIQEPELLLLDEPLSNLDAKLREQMRFELKRLQTELGLTALYVTHDQAEALALSNQIAVMKDGRIQQIGTPREIYERPANQFVADFIGSTNFIEGDVSPSAEGGDGRVVETAQGPIRVEAGSLEGRDGKVLVSIRPEYIAVSEHRPDTTVNTFQGKVVDWVYLGECTDLFLEIGGKRFRVKAHPDLSVSANRELWVHFPPHRCVALVL